MKRLAYDDALPLLCDPADFGDEKEPKGGAAGCAWEVGLFFGIGFWGSLQGDTFGS